MKGPLERIAQGEALVADGAIGSLLFTMGLQPGGCPESVNLERPELLEEIARRYLRAGAQVIQTNTFGGSSLKLSSYGLENKTREINRAAVEAVRAAVGDRAYVYGSCGPTGCTLKPYGETAPEEVYESFRMQLQAILDAGVDLIGIETMTDLAEATLAVRAVRSLSEKVPIMATMTFEPTPRGFFTIMGNDIPHAASVLEEAGADLVGSNCGNGSETMIAIAKEFTAHSRLPLVIQPNAGLPELREGKAVYPETPEFMAEKARELVAAGVSVIGGCCGTTPDHIQAIREVINSATRS
jgi:5-methyltetrahydrofolate--homocysteine methyltransferase